MLSAVNMTLSLGAWGYNYRVTHYVGLNYFPPGMLPAFIILLIVYTGLRLSCSATSRLTTSCFQTILYFLVLSIIAMATIGVQYTPFTPIDPSLITFERYFGLDNGKLLNWLNNYPTFRKLLILSYASLSKQLLLIPLFLIIKNDTKALYNYFFLNVLAVLIGFSIYYFWPSIAPASFIDNPLFVQSQLDTGLKFYQIHYHMVPTTTDGGLIAFPSFHLIWAWIALYVVRQYPLFWWPMLLLNSLLALSCVLLGWHYATDIIGSIGVLLPCHWCLNRIRNGNAV